MNNEFARQLKSNLVTVILFDQREAEINRRHATGTGIKWAVLYEQAIGSDSDLGESQSNILGETPMSRHFASVEQARRCKCVDAGTDAALGVRT